MQKVHFIAIGGSAMHNLALALHGKGYSVSGSDDEIFEPSRSRLQNAGILPQRYGWYPEKISNDVQAVILGMHARPDNPELLRAQELNIPIYSYPEYLYQQSKDKKRIVIGGSHGKTTITSMIMHVMRFSGMDFDFMVGAQLEGFDVMVRLSDAPIMIFEGDEYLSSPIDRRPKFLHYKPHIALLSGIAWDHINVFPTYDSYLEQFTLFLGSGEENALFYCVDDDTDLRKMADEFSDSVNISFYSALENIVENGKTSLILEGEHYDVPIFGDHNMKNLGGALKVCKALGISEKMFFDSMKTFKGAARRLEKIGESEKRIIFKDFAHSPSKLKATTQSVKKQFPDHKLIAVMELHTFSSLSEAFLEHYAHSMDTADTALVYFNPETIKHKKLPPISVDQVMQSFRKDDLNVFTDSIEMKNFLKSIKVDNVIILLMSSGNFDGIVFEDLAAELL